MYNFLLRNGTTIAFVIGFLASAILVIALFSSGAAEYASDDHANLYPIGSFQTAVTIGVIFVVLGLVTIILGGLFGLITNPRASLKFLMGFVVLAVLVGILYAISKEETSGVMRNLVEEYDIKGTISRLISGGILATLILMAIAFITVILAEIRNAFN